MQTFYPSQSVKQKERQTLHFQVFSTYISAFVGQFVREVSTSCPRSQRNHLKRGQCFVKASTLGKYKQGGTRRVRFARPKSIEHKSKVTVLEQVGAHRVTWVWSKNRALEAISLCFAVCAHFKNDLEQTSSIWVIEGVNIYILSVLMSNNMMLANLKVRWYCWFSSRKFENWDRRVFFSLKTKLFSIVSFQNRFSSCCKAFSSCSVSFVVFCSKEDDQM